MKAKNLLDLSELAGEMLTKLSEASVAIVTARFGDMPDEAHRVYLANTKAGVEQALAALTELQRRAESAGWLVQNRENFVGAVEAMQRQEAELAKGLSGAVRETA